MIDRNNFDNSTEQKAEVRNKSSQKADKVKYSLFVLTLSALFTVCLAFLMWLMTGFSDGITGFLLFCKIMFFAFVLPWPLSLVIRWNSPNNSEVEDHDYAYACGLYYGGIGIAAILYSLDMEIPIAIAFLISGLICYIVYLRRKE